MRKTACRAVNTNSENGNRAIELEQQVGAPLNGNKRAVPLLDSATTSIVLPDGRPYPLGQVKDNFNRNGLREGANPHLPQSGSIEPELLDFGAFPDGTLVEVVKSSSQSGRLLFLIWNAGDVKVEKFFHYGGSQFVPPPVDVSLLRATRLPTGITSCGNAAELLSEITRCIADYVDLAPEYLRLVSHFVLCTWFQDRLSIAPYLWVIGPYSAGKTRLLSLLHAFCRRAVMASDISVAALYSVPSVIMPTLLIDEFETGSRVGDRDRLRLLRSGSARDGHVMRGSKVHDTYCAKVVASRQEPSDTALASRAIFIPMLPTRKALPCLDTAALQHIADRFQPQLLNYRLKYYSQVTTGDRPQVAEFAPRMRDLALALAAPVLGDPQLEAQLFGDLAGQDKEAKLARYGEPEWAVATALYLECHVTRGTLTAGSLASTVNDMLLGNGETYELTPRAVGSVLRSLGLNTEKLGNQGRGVRLTNDFVRRVHKLAVELGIRRADTLPYATVDAGYMGYPCSLCADFGLLARDDGTKLRSVDRHWAKPRPGKGLDD